MLLPQNYAYNNLLKDFYTEKKIRVSLLWKRVLPYVAVHIHRSTKPSQYTAEPASIYFCLPTWKTKEKCPYILDDRLQPLRVQVHSHHKLI